MNMGSHFLPYTYFFHVHLHLTLGFCKIAFVKRDRMSWAAGSYIQSPSVEMDVT